MTYMHFDRIGKQLAVGDIVAYSNHNHLAIGKIKKLNPKMLTISSVEEKSNAVKYPSDLIKLEGTEITMFLLRKC